MKSINNINSAFFSTEGLTNASARHYTNIGNEIKRALTAQIDSVSFINSTISMPMSPNQGEMKTAQGYNSTDLKEILMNLDLIGDINAMIAWFQEAMKARDEMINICNNTTFERWMQNNNISIEEPKFKTELKRPIFNTELEQPERPQMVDDDTAIRYRKNNGRRNPDWISNYDVIMEMNVKDRCHLLSLNSKVALIGKYIGEHNGTQGAFLIARKKLYDKLAHEYEVKGEGNDTVITHHTKSVPEAEVEETYFLMQKKHRTLQAEYNGIIHKIEIETQSQFDEMRKKYQADMAEYEVKLVKEHAAFKKATDEYESAYAAEIEEFRKEKEAYLSTVAKYTDEYKQWITEEKARIQALKIVIPNELYPIVELVKKQAAS